MPNEETILEAFTVGVTMVLYGLVVFVLAAWTIAHMFIFHRALP